MVISKNSQLGLRMNDMEVQAEFLRTAIAMKHETVKELQDAIDFIESREADEDGTLHLSVDEESFLARTLSKPVEEYIAKSQKEKSVRDEAGEATGLSGTSIIGGEGSKYFYICDSVYKAAELIKITENFTGRTLKDINFGKYTYLMGKHRMVRFVVVVNYIKGIYYDEEKKIAFSWGIRIEDGEYFFDDKCEQEFTTIMRVLTFVELGDITVKELLAGRNNGEPKKAGKITNTSPNTVYVVDSSWNTIVVRTDGFAVRGHFRLQPCGTNHADRKLIWIDAFEKHGYKRRPRASIIHEPAS